MCSNRGLIKTLQRGFTLIELLIVVIILAILAAIVIPQFTDASVDAKEAALDSNLSAVRSAIELFRVQHGGANPGSVASSGGVGCTGGGTAAANEEQAFMDHLLMASNAAGATCPVADSTYKFGPYLRKGIPVEPITQKGAVVAEIVATAASAPITAGTAGGWAVNTLSGQFIANNTALDSKGKVKYSEH